MRLMDAFPDGITDIRDAIAFLTRWCGTTITIDEGAISMQENNLRYNNVPPETVLEVARLRFGRELAEMQEAARRYEEREQEEERTAVQNSKRVFATLIVLSCVVLGFVAYGARGPLEALLAVVGSLLIGLAGLALSLRLIRGWVIRPPAQHASAAWETER